MFYICILVASLTFPASSKRLIEYRIPLPVAVEEYKLAQLYRVIQESKKITGNGEGVEIVINEPFQGKVLELGYRKGQYTDKIFHLGSKLPRIIRALAPKGSLEIHEKSWNSYPDIYTELSNPDYMKENFHVTIETTCRSGVTDFENVFKLNRTRLQMREVRRIDIATGNIDPNDDPTLFKSQKTGRGPLDKVHWKENTNLYPTMTCYKLVEIEFKWFGLQTTVESRIEKFYTQLFIDFNRRLFTTIDEWYGVTLSDIRKMEEKAKDELDKMRNNIV